MKRSRSGTMMRAAAEATPPPRTMRSGVSIGDDVREADREVVDPRLDGGVRTRVAALVGCERLGRRGRAGRAASAAARTNDSRQPVLPQPQGGAPGLQSMTWCPISPAVPW